MNHKRSFLLPPALAACVALVAGCAFIAIATAPEMVAARDDSGAAKEADDAFWATLHGGRYDQIGATLDLLEASYLQHPNDPRTTAHIAFLHIWRVSESARLDKLSPTIADDVTLAHAYFDDAVRLDPSDSLPP